MFNTQPTGTVILNGNVCTKRGKSHENIAKISDCQCFKMLGFFFFFFCCCCFRSAHIAIVAALISIGRKHQTFKFQRWHESCLMKEVLSLSEAFWTIFCWQLFSGLLVNLSTMGDWLSWIRYLSIFRYSLNVSQTFSLPFCFTAIFCVYLSFYDLFWLIHVFHRTMGCLCL